MHTMPNPSAALILLLPPSLYLSILEIEKYCYSQVVHSNTLQQQNIDPISDGSRELQLCLVYYATVIRNIVGTLGIHIVLGNNVAITTSSHDSTATQQCPHSLGCHFQSKVTVVTKLIFTAQNKRWKTKKHTWTALSM